MEEVNLSHDVAILTVCDANEIKPSEAIENVIKEKTS